MSRLKVYNQSKGEWEYVAYGLRGATGASGPAGNGATGATGPQGPGFTGATGPQGFTGATGQIGASGVSVVGATGASGSQGFTGPSGPSGTPGASGASGTSGLSGSTGSTGPAGLNGNDGATGATGAVGATGPAGSGGGGGGGAWEVIYDETIPPSSFITNLTFDGLDLQSGDVYNVLFSSYSANETTTFQFYSPSGVMSIGWVGTRMENSGQTPQTGFNYISHPSLGPGIGSMVIQKTPNGSFSTELRYQVATDRIFTLFGIDSGWYSGGPNFTKLILRTASDWNLAEGTYVKILKLSA